jgi:type IV secretion system protein VirB3
VADRIFKGATRPAMMMGIPIIPFILTAGVFLLISTWSMVLLGFVWLGVGLVCGVTALGFLRYVSSQDDQRLNQYILYAMSRVHGWRNGPIWKAHSMSPVNYKKRR